METQFEPSQECNQKQPTNDKDEGGGDGGTALARDRLSLPCLNSRNSISDALEEAERWSPIAREYAARKMLEVTAKYVTNKEQLAQIIEEQNGLTSNERKRAFRLGQNVAYLCERVGIEKVGFLTLTFADKPDTEEAQRRFNSLATNKLRGMFGESIVVLEPQRRGSIHYHLLVSVSCDIRTGFDFEGIKRRDYRSANEYLRGLWKELRESMDAYGFGRSELMPIKSTGEGVAKYVGKYISKGVGVQTGTAFEWPKGCRRVRYSQGWVQVKDGFSWVSPGAKLWREKVGAVAAEHQISNIEGMSEAYGQRWAWRMKGLVKDHPEATPRELATALGRMRSMDRHSKRH